MNYPSPKNAANGSSAQRIFEFLLKVLVYSSACYFLSFITADTDLWGHIKFGEHLWLSKALARTDIYSYTAYGREWINHEWLSELLMYFVYEIFGSPGLLIGKLLVGFAIIFLLSQISFHRTSHPLVYSLVFILAVFVMSPGFMTRPQILTFFFTSLFLYVIHLYLEREKNLLWSLPLIMLFWVNCHGGFVIGLGMFPVVVVCEIIACRFRNGNRTHLRSLIFWLVLTEASVLINPYGYRLLVFLYKTLIMPRNIWEWSPVSIFDFSYLRFKLFAVLFVLTLFFDKKMNRYWEIGIIVIAMLFAVRQQRHTPIFAIVAAPYLAERLGLLAKRINLYDKIRSFPSLLLMIVFVCILTGYQLFSTTGKYIETRCNIIVDPHQFPIYGVQFLKENKINGNILLPFGWGEYVIWKLYPECKVSIDGRFRTVYPEEVLDDHFGVLGNKANWLELLDKYPTDIILVRRDLFFQQLIKTQQKWIYVYSDNLSMIFVKNEESRKELLVKLGRKELVYPRKKLSIYFP